MATALWSMKGGSGVSSVACMLAIAQVERASPTALLDLDGDVPALLGMNETDGPGLADWLATPSRSSSTLARITQDVAPDLQVIVRGKGVLSPDAEVLVEALADFDQLTIVDCGTLSTAVAVGMAAAATQRLVVTRPCYLALRALRATPVRPTGVIMVDERGRALGRSDVEAVVGAPVIASIASDPAIARALDAGLLSTRLPRGLIRALGSVVAV